MTDRDRSGMISSYDDRTANGLNAALRTSSALVLTASLTLCGVAGLSIAHARAQGFDTKHETPLPVDFAADSLVHDEERQLIVADGNVEFVQGNRIVRADRVVYTLRDNGVYAEGHVVMNDEDGSVYFADRLTFTKDLREGYIANLRTVLADGSRFRAAEGERTSGRTIVMKSASYTPCEPCKTDPSRAPAWAIRAEEVVHDQEKRQIQYQNAHFEFGGIPLIWVPYFSHPDGTLDRKSGFLSPRLGWDSELGAQISNAYYWSIAPDKDATLGIMALSNEAPVLFGEWRRRWQTAELTLNGSTTYSSRPDREAGEEVTRDEEIRGHVFAEGLWDISRTWRAGLNLELTSDNQYLKQYDISGEDVLENEIYAERLSGRNYTAGRLLAFQDVRVREERIEQVDVLPEIEMHFMGDPDETLGGRWAFDMSALNLRKEGNDQDVARMISRASWARRFLSDYGFSVNTEMSVRGDYYYVTDSDYTTSGLTNDENVSETRWIPRWHTVAAYPLIKPVSGGQAVIEPLVALTLAPNIDVEEDIPNEDSQDVQIDASNLFEADRFPGEDLIEDQSRATYGLRGGIHGYGGSRVEAFLGQSYRFSSSDNPFPRGSGLDRQSSDIVGQVSALVGDRFSLDYRFQLDNEDLSNERDEVSLYAEVWKLDLSADYLYARGLEGTDIDESREQVKGRIDYHFVPDWTLRIGATQDLGENPGLREAELGLVYDGQCLDFEIEAERSLADESSGDSGTEIMFRIGFKNLGEFRTSGLSIGDSNDDEDDEN